MTTKEQELLTMFSKVAPQFHNLTLDVLFGEVWTEQTLTQRERSLITVAALVSLNRTEQLPGHLTRALSNGISVEELSATITHLAFYTGWPTAASAIERLGEMNTLRDC